ncbi:hypothetical protein [Sorangium cellulosum]|uniref:hypothetical protein n=1 Tax=Sorangium TaxID=39643 RepID=UPI001F3C8703|nr:hypothetical protein [Sorangium cellulosum]
MIWFQYFAKPSRTAPLVVMLPTNFSLLGEPPVPSLPPVPPFEPPDPPPPSLELPVEELVVPGPPAPLVTDALLLAVVLPLVVLPELTVLLAAPEPPAPSSTPPSPPEHPKRAATPSAIHVVPHSHREERFLFIVHFRELSRWWFSKRGSRWAAVRAGAHTLCELRAKQLGAYNSRLPWK